MNVIKELEKTINIGIRDYKDFYDLNNDFVKITGNKAIQIVTMYKLLKRANSMIHMYVGAGDCAWEREFEDLEKEING